ncbi:MAG: hypothetical protein M1819_004530 [Sarea resinae]|nr:MAG: hypothetical protein M1819_004530 [Sarea resinae]
MAFVALNRHAIRADHENPSAMSNGRNVRYFLKVFPKDKTLSHILDSLIRLEGKIDGLSLDRPSSVAIANPSASSVGSPTSRSAFPNFDLKPPQDRLIASSRTNDTITGYDLSDKNLPRSAGHLTAAHQILLWPAIHKSLLRVGIQSVSDLPHFIQRDGIAWVLRFQGIHLDLPDDEGLKAQPVNSTISEGTVDTRVVFPELSYDTMRNLATVFFDTFNLAFPFMCRQTFFQSTLATVVNEGFANGGIDGVIVLLVLALGKLALDGSLGEPISNHRGRPSGIRGGTAKRPPGLALFNEARRRMGFVLTRNGLGNVQIFCLAGLYFSACNRYIEFYRMAITASMSCRMLIKCDPLDWSSHHGDLVKRAYWHCVIIESNLHFELDLPPTGIEGFEDEMPLPSFIGPVSIEDDLANEKSHYHYYFLAQVALRRLSSRVHSTIYDVTVKPGRNEVYGGPGASVIKELARQLESWRSLLPHELQWEDEKALDVYHPDLGHSKPLFSFGNLLAPVAHQYNADLIVAALRSRFYYLRYMIYRPFVYKALHYPNHMTQEDIECCIICLKSCLNWPIYTAPPRDKKRLIPYVFSWTPNILGILLILHMTTENRVLKYIRESQFAPGELEQSASLMLDFILDMRQVDGIAELSWDILKPLYTRTKGGDGWVFDE